MYVAVLLKRGLSVKEIELLAFLFVPQLNGGTR